MIDLTKQKIVSDAPYLVQLGLHVGVASVTVADQIGLYDALAKKSASPGALADELDLIHRGADAICAVLVQMEMLHAQGDGTYALSDVAQTYWVKDSPFYRGTVLGYRHTEWHQKRMLNALKEGGGDDPINAMWEAGSVNEEAAQLFTAIMHELSLAPSIAALRSGTFDSTQHIVDAGGGSGAFCAAFVGHRADAQATLFELPPICEKAQGYLSKYDRHDAVSLYPADFFRDPWPAQGDAFFFGNILHGWELRRARQLLSFCHDALPKGGRIFIHEILLDPGRISPPEAVYFNMMMFLTHGTGQFTFDELATLLIETGFKSPRVANTFGSYSLIVADKV